MKKKALFILVGISILILATLSMRGFAKSGRFQFYPLTLNEAVFYTGPTPTCEPNPYPPPEGCRPTPTPYNPYPPPSTPTNGNAYLPIIGRPHSPTPTLTRTPTQTPTPTRTATPVPTNPVIAKNNPGTITDNDVTVDITRILFGDKAWLNLNFYNFDVHPIMQDKITAVEIMFRVTNNTGITINNNEFTGLAAVNGEQADFGDYTYGENNMFYREELGDPILPGSTVEGYIWFGIKNTTWDNVNNITILYPHFFDSQTYYSITDDFLFSIPVVGWIFEPMP